MLRLSCHFNMFAGVMVAGCKSAEAAGTWWVLAVEAAIISCLCGTYWFLVGVLPWFQLVLWLVSMTCGSTCGLMRVVLLCRASCGPTCVVLRITTRVPVHPVELTALFRL
jgi:hypothetical protein